MSLEQLGRYEIIGELGRGAMGVVYKARDPLIDRTVALKTVGIAVSREEAEAFEPRFYREAKSAGRLNHSNIVTIHDVGKSGEVAYIAMEFLDGRSLREILDSGVVLPPEKIADIAAQVADGLAFAHQNNIVHRDIKPANIMLLDNGVVKITDFGIALLPTGSRTLAGTVFGSPKYISPEQVDGGQVDGRSDIFSLGAVVYEMLTGLPPFYGSDLNAILYQVINEMPEAPSSRNASIAPAFDRIVARALAKDPADRYPDAKEMASDLRSAAPAPVGAPRIAPRRTPARASAAIQRAETVRADAQPTVGPPPAVLAAAGIGSSPWPRKLLLVGVPAALIAAIAAWALVPGRTPISDQPAVNLAVAVLSEPESKPAPIDSGGVTGAAALAAMPASQAAAAPPVGSVRTAPIVNKPLAKVALAVAPWGEVYVDGKKKGLSPPMTEMRLAPGRHTIEIRNTTFRPHSETVDLKADANIKIKYKFQ